MTIVTSSSTAAVTSMKRLSKERWRRRMFDARGYTTMLRAALLVTPVGRLSAKRSLLIAR